MISRWSSLWLLHSTARLVLALLVMGIATAWAPVPAQGYSEGVSSLSSESAPVSQISIQHPYFRASITGNQIYIQGSNFRPTHAFFVRVSGRNTGNSIKVGTVRPRGDGTISAYFRLPSRFRNVTRLRVCLKEVYRGYLVCATAKHKP